MGLPGAKGAVSIMNSTVADIERSSRSDRSFSDLRKKNTSNEFFITVKLNEFQHHFFCLNFEYS